MDGFDARIRWDVSACEGSVRLENEWERALDVVDLLIEKCDTCIRVTVIS